MPGYVKVAYTMRGIYKEGFIMRTHKTLEERAAEYGGRLNLDGEYDWGEPVGREIW